MEIILLENIINLGNIGDKVVVKPGYGRNYLLKTGKALRYSKENLEHVSKKKDELNKKNVELKKKLRKPAPAISVFLIRSEGGICSKIIFAISSGGFFNFFDSTKQRLVEKSPWSIIFGLSITIIDESV